MLNICDSIHVVLGRSAAGSLDESKHLVIVLDPLNVGPCSSDPVEHERLRSAYWASCEVFKWAQRHVPGDRRMKREHEHPSEMGSSILELQERLQGFPASLPIVLWRGPAWADNITVCWAAHAIFTSRIKRSRVWIAEPVACDDKEGPSVVTLGCFNELEFAQGLAQANPMKSSDLNWASELWQAFAGPDADRFDALRREGSAEACGFDLHPYRYGFPRVDRDNQLTLSELDAALLRTVSQLSSCRAVDIAGLNHRCPIMCSYGGECLAWRLHEWSEHDVRGRVVRRSDGPKHVPARIGTTYSLTDLGAELLRSGLRDLRDAPGFDIGGCRAYEAPWAVQLSSDTNEWTVRAL